MYSMIIQILKRIWKFEIYYFKKTFLNRYLRDFETNLYKKNRIRTLKTRIWIRYPALILYYEAVSSKCFLLVGSLDYLLLLLLLNSNNWA